MGSGAFSRQNFTISCLSVGLFEITLNNIFGSIYQSGDVLVIVRPITAFPLIDGREFSRVTIAYPLAPPDPPAGPPAAPLLPAV